MKNTFNLNKNHFDVMFSICSGFINIQDDFKKLMTDHNVDKNLQKRILLCMKLSENPSKKFPTDDGVVLSYIITYFIHLLDYHRERIDELFNWIDKKLTKEYKTNIINKDAYLKFRRYNFEVMNLSNFIKANDYSLTIYNDNSFRIQTAV